MSNIPTKEPYKNRLVIWLLAITFSWVFMAAALFSLWMGVKVVSCSQEHPGAHCRLAVIHD